MGRSARFVVAESPRNQHQRAFEHHAGDADDQNGDDDVGEVEVVPLVPQPEADAGAACQHFSGDDHQPGGADRQPHAGHHVGHDRGQQNLGEHLPGGEVEHAGHVQIIRRNALHADGGVDHHRPDGADENGVDGRRRRIAEHIQPDGQPGQRRHRTQQADERREHAVQELHAANGETQRNAYQRRQTKAVGHSLQRGQQVPADAHIVRSVVIKGMRKHLLRRLPGDQRRGELRAVLGRQFPHQQQECEAHQRGDEAQRDLAVLRALPLCRAHGAYGSLLCSGRGSFG